MKQVYAAYCDKGFEMVGLTLENARLQPGDTPEQRAERLENAKKKLTDFTAENVMPWPQSFDGKGWSADIPKQFAVFGRSMQTFVSRSQVAMGYQVRSRSCPVSGCAWSGKPPPNFAI
ncbi:MAG: hypothetical protein U1F61_03645 [Opitutaceae bacterium]